MDSIHHWQIREDSRLAGFAVATIFFLLTGWYGWAVFELPACSPVGMPDASASSKSSRSVWN